MKPWVLLQASWFMCGTNEQILLHKNYIYDFSHSRKYCGMDFVIEMYRLLLFRVRHSITFIYIQVKSITLAPTARLSSAACSLTQDWVDWVSERITLNYQRLKILLPSIISTTLIKNKRRSRGTRLKPCGIPDVPQNSIEHLQFQLYKVFPTNMTLSGRFVWGRNQILSKAFSKSVYITSFWPDWSIEFSTFSKKETRLVVMDLIGIKLYWLTVILLHTVG